MSTNSILNFFLFNDVIKFNIYFNEILFNDRFENVRIKFNTYFKQREQGKHYITKYIEKEKEYKQSTRATRSYIIRLQKHILENKFWK